MDRRGFLLLAGAAVTDAWVSWAGHDAEGNTASGRVPLKRKPRPTPTPTPTPGYVTPPASIAADGSVEVTDALNAWLQTVPDGATLDFRPTTYWCDRALKVTGKQGWTWLPGTLVRKTTGVLAWPTPNPHLWFIGCHDLTLGDPTDGLRVLGTNTVQDQKAGFGAYKQAYEFEAAVRAEGCRNFQSHAELLDGIWGDGWQLQPSGSVACDGFRITGHVDRIGRQGVTPIGTNGYVSVAVDHPRRSLIDLEPAAATWECHDILIEKCTGAPIGKPIAALGRGRVDNITVQDCRWSGPAVPTIIVNASDGSRRSNWIYRRNTSDGLGSPAAAVSFARVDGVVVEDNVHPVSNNQSRRSAEFVNCGGLVAFRRNNMAFGTGGGIYIDNTSPAAGQVTDFSDNTPTQTVRTA